VSSSGKNKKSSRWVTEIRRRWKSRYLNTAAFIVALTMTWSGFNARMSVWRVGELIVYGDFQNRADKKPGFKDQLQPGVFANIRYEEGKAYRPIDSISNAITPVIITHGVIAPIVAGIACLRRRHR
jgi:hypothetical protein